MRRRHKGTFSFCYGDDDYEICVYSVLTPNAISTIPVCAATAEYDDAIILSRFCKTWQDGNFGNSKLSIKQCINHEQQDQYPDHLQDK